MVGGAGLLVGGVVLLLRSAYLYLRSALAPPAAVLGCGALTLVAAGGLLWLARRLTR